MQNNFILLIWISIHFLDAGKTVQSSPVLDLNGLE